MSCGIYKITCKESGQCYIGQSKAIEQRWLKHQKRFSQALFTYEILRIVSIPQFMNAFEKFYIKLYDSHANGFNKTIGGTGFKTSHPDAETRAKIGAASKGRFHSDDIRKKISVSSSGKKFSDDHRAKISAGQTGLKRGPLTPEHRAKIVAAAKLRKDNKGLSDASI